MWLEGKSERKIDCIGFENKKIECSFKAGAVWSSKTTRHRKHKKTISGIVRVNENIANSEKQRKGN